MRTGSFLCLSPGFIVNSPLSAPPPPAFSHLLRESSSERPFCSPKHPRFEHFPPLFSVKTSQVLSISPRFLPTTFSVPPKQTRVLSKTGRIDCKGPPVYCCQFPFAHHRTPRRFAVLRASAVFRSALSAFFASAVAALRRVAEVPHNSPSPPSVRAAPPSILPFVNPTAVKSAPHHCTFAHPMRQKHRIPARKTQICALLFAGCHRNCIFAVSYILVHGIYRAANRRLPWRQR